MPLVCPAASLSSSRRYPAVLLLWPCESYASRPVTERPATSPSSKEQPADPEAASGRRRRTGYRQSGDAVDVDNFTKTADEVAPQGSVCIAPADSSQQPGSSFFVTPNSPPDNNHRQPAMIVNKTERTFPNAHQPSGFDKSPTTLRGADGGKCRVAVVVRVGEGWWLGSWQVCG